MKRYYNKTKLPIPYCVTNFNDYLKNDLMQAGEYISSKPWKSKNLAGFTVANLVFLFKRKDFDKLSII